MLPIVRHLLTECRDGNCGNCPRWIHSQEWGTGQFIEIRCNCTKCHAEAKETANGYLQHRGHSDRNSVEGGGREAGLRDGGWVLDGRAGVRGDIDACGGVGVIRRTS